jgi:ubiquinone/menaquinone biosynthesis C-methylase UbiE
VAGNEDLKDQQRRQWRSNAASWDSQHDRLERETAAVTQWLCREARIGPGMRVLDVACGSGHPAFDLARLLQPGGSVLATDLVEEMVEATLRRAREAGIRNLEGRVMDAEAIDLPDEGFDAVTCRFGVMFCPEPLKAMQEVRRVLKPGGRFALSVWDEAAKSPGQTVLGEALERFGRPRQPVDYSAPGIYQLAPPGKLEGLLKEAGFSGVSVESLPLPVEYETFEALWERTMARPGPQRNLVQELSADELARLQDILADVVQRFTREGTIRLTMTALCASGVR